ncbi:hypothetical protein CEV08_00390 [Bartonella tribocorum]|uniref:Uncharacterized protein n=1 Tax=Bartonella tribocorum TaxID=85701 RepID=A0A2M6UXX8_9HYPH|nr:hypothetical protein CEV08_00390 [Bartonella tribocorum]
MNLQLGGISISCEGRVSIKEGDKQKREESVGFIRYRFHFQTHLTQYFLIIKMPMYIFVHRFFKEITFLITNNFSNRTP